ncbi:MAG: STAS domain-containing protein [Devosia sp.]|nr:STAS domain-containing protein [Devosia sp.]
MTDARSYTLILGGDATIKAAQDVAAALRQALDAHADIGIDTQTMTGADLTTVQALLSARIKAGAEGKALVMLAPIAEPLRRVLEAAGLLAAEATATFWAGQSHQTIGASTP